MIRTHTLADVAVCTAMMCALIGAPSSAGDGGVSGSGIGGGGCNPFALVDAYGNLYGISSTGSGADVRDMPVDMETPAGPIPLFTQSGTPG